MPYYPQQMGWGEALAMWGNTLSNWGRRREEEAVNRLKNRYGTNIEAWRQDAIRNPQGEEAKYYRKFVGDPSTALPEDPQVAQQRQLWEQKKAWISQLPPDMRQYAEGLLVDMPPSVVEAMIRRVGQQSQPAVSPQERLKTLMSVQAQWPNAPAKATEQMTTYGTTGQLPAQINLENTPGNTAGMMKGLAQGGTAGLLGEMQKQYVPASETQLLGEMGQTKQQVTAEQRKARQEASKKSAERADKELLLREKDVNSRIAARESKRKQVLSKGDQTTNLPIKAFDQAFDVKEKQMKANWQDAENKVKAISTQLKNVNPLDENIEATRTALESQLTAAEETAKQAKSAYMALDYMAEYRSFVAGSRTSPAPVPTQNPGPPSGPVTTTAPPPVKKDKTLGL